jgi:hypothetical protein
MTSESGALRRWWLLLSIGMGMLLTVVALKLVALFGAAANVSLLRDVGQNVNLPGAFGGLPAVLAAWLGWPFRNDPYPPPPAPGTGPYSPAGPGQYGPYGNPWPGTDINGVPYNTYIGPGGRPAMDSRFPGYTPPSNFMSWFNQQIQNIAGTENAGTKAPMGKA